MDNPVNRLISIGVHPTQAKHVGNKLHNVLSHMGLTRKRGHEFVTACIAASDGFRALEVSLWFEDLPSLKVAYPVVATVQSPEVLVRNPKALADLLYGNTPGNECEHDAWTYRPRGIFPIFGRTHYRTVGNRADLGDLLVRNPYLLGEVDDALLVAATVWGTQDFGQDLYTRYCRLVSHPISSQAFYSIYDTVCARWRLVS